MKVRHCIDGIWLTVDEHPYKVGKLIAVVTSADPEYDPTKATVLEVKTFDVDGQALEWFRGIVAERPWAS